MYRARACFALVFALCFAAAAGAAPAWAAGAGSRGSEIAVAQLPVEARATLSRIKRGGPFRYRQDGGVFGNREQRLPVKERGHYREYTVPTPGAKDRGARRIVAGAVGRADAEYYYSDDHYNSFRRIRE